MGDANSLRLVESVPAERVSDIASVVASETGLVASSLERALARPAGSVLIRSGPSATVAELAASLRRHGVVTAIESVVPADLFGERSTADQGTGQRPIGRNARTASHASSAGPRNPPPTGAGTTAHSTLAASRAVSLPLPDLPPPLMIVFAGATVAAIGLFLPVLSGPFGLRMSYFGAHEVRGLLVMAAIAGGTWAVYQQRHRLGWVLMAVAAGVPLLTFLDVLSAMSQLRAEIRSDDPFGFGELLLASVQIQYGWFVLFAGLAAMLVGNYLAQRNAAAG